VLVAQYGKAFTFLKYFFLSFEYLILDLIKIFCQIRPFQAY
jgi:hypothetical protein